MTAPFLYRDLSSLAREADVEVTSRRKGFGWATIHLGEIRRLLHQGCRSLVSHEVSRKEATKRLLSAFSFVSIRRRISSLGRVATSRKHVSDSLAQTLLELHVGLKVSLL